MEQPSKHNSYKKTQHKKLNKIDNSSRLELGLVKAWQNQSWWLWLLLPFSLLYGLIVFIRRKLYNLGVLSTYRAQVPVMVIGNITIGGSGKTPLIIALVKYLKSQNIKVGVISRGYGGNQSLMPCIVSQYSMPNEVGDEPCLIVRETEVVMSVCPNRKLAIECLLDFAPDTQIIIADDGLQHYKLQRDIEWIVVDSERGFGNHQLLPTGFLREPISRLKNTTVIYHVATVNQQDEYNLSSESIKKDKLLMYLEPTKLEPLLPIGDEHNPNKVDSSQRVYALTGIGFPQRFFNTLLDLGYDLITITKPDHHQFCIDDLQHLTEHPIIITAKDAVKIAPLILRNPSLASLDIWVLPVNAVLSENCYQTLNQQLQKFHIN